MSSSREIKRKIQFIRTIFFLYASLTYDYPTELQRAKTKAQNSSNLREEANICNQLGELLSRNGKRASYGVI